MHCQVVRKCSLWQLDNIDVCSRAHETYKSPSSIQIEHKISISAKTSHWTDAEKKRANFQTKSVLKIYLNQFHSLSIPRKNEYILPVMKRASGCGCWEEHSRLLMRHILYSYYIAAGMSSKFSSSKPKESSTIEKSFLTPNPPWCTNTEVVRHSIRPNRYTSSQ